MNEVVETAATTPAVSVFGVIAGIALLYFIFTRFIKPRMGGGSGGGGTRPGGPGKKKL